MKSWINPTQLVRREQLFEMVPPEGSRDRVLTAVQLGNLVDWINDGVIKPKEFNRGSEKFSKKTYKNVLDNFIDVGLGCTTVAVDPVKKIVELVDSTSRMRGVSQLMKNPSFEAKYYSYMQPVVIVHYNDRVPAYSGINTMDSHKTKNMISNPELPLGKMRERLLSAIGKNIPDETAMGLLDIVLAVHHGLFEKNKSEIPAVALRSGRTKLDDLKIADNMETIAQSVYDKVTSGYSKWLILCDIVASKGTIVTEAKKGRKKKPVLMTYAKNTIASKGLMLTFVLENIFGGDISTEPMLTLAERMVYDYNDQADLRIHKQVLENARRVSQKCKTEAIERGYRVCLAFFRGRKSTISKCAYGQ